MVQTILDEVKAYFDAKENPTEEERRLRQCLSEGYFPIASVHRNDLQDAGFDVERISDDDMKELAGRMASDYCDQLFWGSIGTIADILGFPRKKGPACPKCESGDILLGSDGAWHCNECGQMWNDKLYVLVEFPEDASFFEENGIGYPSWNSGDNGARYVPEAEYIREFGESPEPEKCYRAMCWPDSQEYIEKDGYELIQDENGIHDFGTSACWVPLSLIKKMQNLKNRDK